MLVTLQTGGILRWVVIALPAPCAAPHSTRKQWHCLKYSCQDLKVFWQGLAGLCAHSHPGCGTGTLWMCVASSAKVALLMNLKKNQLWKLPEARLLPLEELWPSLRLMLPSW